MSQPEDAANERSGSEGNTCCAREVLRLEWDSKHFGIPVARIVSEELDDRRLAAVLAEARDAGLALLYWSTTPNRIVSALLLREFRGRLVDRKAVFIADLEAGEDFPPNRNTPIEVSEYPRGEPSEDLLALGRAAGALSRFAADPNIPGEKATRLFEIWTARGALGEMADVVLVARLPEAPLRIAGMVTVSVENGTASIGLVAVREWARGRGVATALIRVARRWMRDAGAKTATVVTQMANTAARALYERCGYRLLDVGDFYHFWPLATMNEESGLNSPLETKSR
jgi:ribosomal protein S18 acetylase RimI-like enzyme